MSKPGARKVKETVSARVYRLGAEPRDDFASTTTAAERLELLAMLSRRAWEFTGKPWPSSPRAAWPVTIVRPR